MRKNHAGGIFTCCCTAIACCLAMTQRASATLFYYDQFTYSNGSLTTQSGAVWGSHSGAGSTPVLVSSNTIILAQGSGSREDVNRPITPVLGAGQTLYAAFDVSVAGGNTEVYFAHDLVGTSTFRARIFITTPVSGGDYTFGLSDTGTLAVKWATGLTFGTTYRVVTSYEYDTGATKLWVNPVNESSTSISTTGTAATAIEAYAFRQAAGNSTQTIDNLAVATTFAEALTGSPAATGACCYGGTCHANETQTACQVTHSGTYLGNGSDCTGDPCSLGACCVGGGNTCTQTIPSQCVGVGDVYHGQGTPCTPNPCGPTGACCLPDTTCQLTTSGICSSLGGSYQGDATSCFPLPCGPTGACCVFDGTCITDVTQSECAFAQGHQWTQGAGSCVPSCTAASAQPVIISEYYESAPGNRKALELYNTSSSTVSLNGHAIARYSNLNVTPDAYFFLDGLTIGAHDTLVLINNADDDIPGLDESRAVVAGVLTMNGDDALALTFGLANGTETVLDRFGVPGQQDVGPRGTDPYADSAWERNCNITVGTNDFDACNFDGQKSCGAAGCPPGTNPANACANGTHANEWTFEGRNLAGDNNHHSLGSHLCVANTGACCVGNGCTIRTLAECNSAGGTFTLGVPCNPLPCGTTGACCETNVTCEDGLTVSECAAFSRAAGWVSGGNCETDCPNKGACCVGVDGFVRGVQPGCNCPGDMDLSNVVDLDDVDEFVAAVLNNVYDACADTNGDSVDNGRDIQSFTELVIALTSCNTSGCFFVTEAECTTMSGTYRGDGVACDPTPCGPTGSCCAANILSCTDDVTVEQCTALDPTATWTQGGTCAANCQPNIPSGLVINEFWADDALGDNAEYIELYCPTCGGQSLSGLSVIIVDGDTAGDTNASQYRRVIGRWDLTGVLMPLDGYLVIGGGTTPNVDISFNLGDSGFIQNGTQTYAIVRTIDLAFETTPADKLTAASEAAITSNLIDGISETDDLDDPFNDHTYFGTPVLESNFGVDTASRIPNGVDTNTIGDWAQQDNFTVELFDANDLLATPGAANTTNPVGVCCDGSSVCSTLTKSDCEDGTPAGGVWQGRQFNCSNPNLNPCLPFGACCLAGNICEIRNSSTCASGGGTYQGDNTSCTPLPCGPTGSCCAQNFSTCTDDLTQAECTAVSATATWTSGGTCAVNCVPPFGACCVENTCTDGVTRTDCYNQVGVYYGDGSQCASVTCPPPIICLIISEVVDGDRTGGTPKWVEITNTGSTDYTFPAGGIIIQSNANNDVIVDVNLTGETILAGDSYVVASSATGGQAIFEDTYGFPADKYSSAGFGNGDDRYILTDTADGSNLIDIYGVFGSNASGDLATYNYTDSYAFRASGDSQGNHGTYNSLNWLLGGAGALDGGSGAGAEALAKQLLIDNTTPGVHDFVPCTGTPPNSRNITQCTSCSATTWCRYEVVGDSVPGTSCVPGIITVGTQICVPCNGSCDPLNTVQLFHWVEQNCYFKAKVVNANCAGSCVSSFRFNNAP